MGRCERRFEAEKEKVRRRRILRYHRGDRDCPKPWHDVIRECMTTPMWWYRETSTKPSRVETARLLHGVLMGRDPDAHRWPDYRRPEEYYW